MSLDVSADISLKLGESIDKLAKVLGATQALRTHPAQAQNVLTPIATFTSGAQLTSIGSPPGGMAWEVERITFDVAPGGAVATPGTVLIFIGATCIARTTVVPNAIFFRGYQCYVIPGQDLYAAWVGGVGSPLLVDVSAAEFPLLGRVDTNA